MKPYPKSGEVFVSDFFSYFFIFLGLALLFSPLIHKSKIYKNVLKNSPIQTKYSSKISTKVEQNKITSLKPSNQKGIVIPIEKYNWKALVHFLDTPSRNLKFWKDYSTQKGDNIYKIGRRFKIRPVDIIAVNPQIKNPDQISVGSIIHIPVAF